MARQWSGRADGQGDRERDRWRSRPRHRDARQAEIGPSWWAQTQANWRGATKWYRREKYAPVH